MERPGETRRDQERPTELSSMRSRQLRRDCSAAGWRSKEGVGRQGESGVEEYGE